MNVLTTPDTVAALVRKYRFRFGNEKELQEGLARVFTDACLVHAREVHLGTGDIIDFMLEGNLGVEVKIGGSLSDLTRQLHRYAGYPTVEALLVVTSKCSLDNLPVVLRGKPITVVALKGAFL